MEKHPNIDERSFLRAVDQCFNKTALSDIKEKYLPAVKDVGKWICYSDYCLDDKGKPNDVITFTLVPYIHAFDELTAAIQGLANRDIKNTRQVQKEFTEFLKLYPLINFSFIVNNRKEMLGTTGEERKTAVLGTIDLLKKQYQGWSNNEPDKRQYYGKLDKQLNKLLQEASHGRKIKEMIDMMLVTALGAYVSARIVENVELVNFAWFSDRDAINDVAENYSMHLFQSNLHTMLGGRNYQFFVAPAGSKNTPFYDTLIRLPDYVAGTLADYNLTSGFISKDKFGSMLTDYMADNRVNNYVFRMISVDECSRVTIHRTASEA